MERNICKIYSYYLNKYPGTMVILIVITWLLCISLSYDKISDVNVDPPLGRSAYLPLSSSIVEKYDSYLFAKKVNYNSSRMVPIRTFNNDESFIMLIYSAYNGNMLTQQNIAEIKAFEDTIRDHPSFKQYCLLCPPDNSGITIPGCTSSTQCQPPLSLVNYFYPNNTLTPSFANTLASLTTSTALYNNINGTSFFFSADMVVNGNVARRVRSLFRTGLPLSGYNNPADTPHKQIEIADYNILNVVKDIIQPSVKAYPNFRINFGGGNGVLDYEVEEAKNKDTPLLVGAVMFVWFYMCFHIKKIGIASAGLFHILMSIPMATFFDRVILGIFYFDILNLLMLFVIMGIGADDCFVFYDAWVQSAHEFTNVNKRLEWSLSRSSKAMFVTSFTTVGAFLATLTTPIMPLQGFVIFASFLVLFNFLHVITFFPAVVLLHYKYYNKASVEFVDESINKSNINDSTLDNNDANDEIEKKDNTIKSDDNDIAKEVDEGETVGGITAYGMKNRRKVEQFLFRKYVPFLYADEGFTKPPRLTRDDSNSGQYYSIIHDFLKSAFSKNSRVIVVYGLSEDVDRLGHSPFDFASEDCDNRACGKVIFDNTFSLKDPLSQQSVITVCEKGINVTNTEELLSCFMKDFKKWRTNRNETFPVPSNEFDSAMKLFLIENKQYIDEKEIMVDETTGVLKYATVTFSTVYDRLHLRPWSAISPLLDDFEMIVREENKKNPVGSNKAFVSSADGLFSRSELTKIVIESAKRNIGIAIAIATIVVLGFVRNFELTFHVIFWVCAVVSCVIGTLQLFVGWTLGPLESVACTIVVGFSVDFVVHIAHHYISSNEYPLRTQRATKTLLEMGVSVINGATSTIGASLFLLPTQFVGFNKFGTFLCITMAFSVTIAMLPFISTLAYFGPEYNQGDISHIFCWKKRDKDGNQATVSKRSLQVQDMTSTYSSSSKKLSIK